MFIPVRADVPIAGRPWANIAVMALTICISSVALLQENGELFLTLAGIERQIDPWTGQLTPNKLLLPVYAVTSSFLHAGWLHLAGNMLFLWIFGNAVNYKFRHLGYLALYFGTAMAGGLVHYLIEGTPVVGASTAINGVMAAFLVYFPRNDVKVLYFLGLWFGTWRMSGIWFVLLGVAWDVLYLAIGARVGTALWAHIFGFLTGFAVALVCLMAGWAKPDQDEESLLQMLGISR